MFREDCEAKGFADDPEYKKLQRPRRIVVRCTDPDVSEEVVIELPNVTETETPKS